MATKKSFNSQQRPSVSLLFGGFLIVIASLLVLMMMFENNLSTEMRSKAATQYIPPVCTSGFRRCNGNKVEVCLNGTAWIYEKTCIAPSYCSGTGCVLPSPPPVSAAPSVSQPSPVISNQPKTIVKSCLPGYTCVPASFKKCISGNRSNTCTTNSGQEGTCCIN